MCESLSEILLERGLKGIDVVDLLELPLSQDAAVRGFLEQLLAIARREDEEAGVEVGDDFFAAAEVYNELERLWDEGIDLTTEDGRVVDTLSFWRMLAMLQPLWTNELCRSERDAEGGDAADDDADADDDAHVAGCLDELVNALSIGFGLCTIMPLSESPFEAVLAGMPSEVCQEFLMSLSDEDRLRCLMRLTLADDGWLFQMDEYVIRTVLRNGGSMVRNNMMQLLEGLDVEFTLDTDARCDEAWVMACPNQCEYCQQGMCVSDGDCCCAGDDCPCEEYSDAAEAAPAGVPGEEEAPDGAAEVMPAEAPNEDGVPTGEAAPAESPGAEETVPAAEAPAEDGVPTGEAVPAEAPDEDGSAAGSTGEDPPEHSEPAE